MTKASTVFFAGLLMACSSNNTNINLGDNDSGTMMGADVVTGGDAQTGTDRPSTTGDASTTDRPTTTTDRPTTTTDAGGDMWGQCGMAAYQGLCRCAMMTDMTAMTNCQQQLFMMFPACNQCLAQQTAMVCCPTQAGALQDCANTHMCADQACVTTNCASQAMALQTCQMTSQSQPACQTALSTCIAGFPRLTMCTTM